MAAATGTPLQMESIRTLLTFGEGPVGDKVTGTLVLDNLDYFAEVGLITLGTHVEVPPALVVCMTNALADALDG